MSVLYAPLFNSQLLEQKKSKQRWRSSSTESNVEQIIYSVQINVVADIHISLGKSGDLRPGSVFRARAPRLRTHAACGFVVCVIIT